MTFEVNDSTFRYGDFINALLTFVIIAAVVFFFVVKPVNALMARYSTEPDVERETRECPACLSHVPVGARRCAFCTQDLPRLPVELELVAAHVVCEHADHAPSGEPARRPP